MDVSNDTARLLSAVSDLPEEIIHIIHHGSNAAFLDTISEVAFQPTFTDKILTSLEPLLVEVSSRKLAGVDSVQAAAFLGRVLHFSPYLAESADRCLARFHPGGCVPNVSDAPDESPLRELLLGTFRLLVFDERSFRRQLSIDSLRSLLSHASRPVRYLAIRSLCLVLHAADAAMERMIESHLGKDAILGSWEGKNIDFRFLSLWEEKRYRDLGRALKQTRLPGSSHFPLQGRLKRVLQANDFSPLTANVHGVLLPRSRPLSSSLPAKTLVPVQSTVQNLQNFGGALLKSGPVILTGVPGAGKTLLVSHMASQLGKLDGMVTLHLNEQSDAKLLIGMYTTGATPGTFSWQPGVLTTAVREGRWVFIEDLDRAPNEIISTLLPLIERRELLIPSRSEVVRAAHGFKIIASTSTSIDLRGREIDSTANMLGRRFWQQVPVVALRENELDDVLSGLHLSLSEHSRTLISVFTRLQGLQTTHSHSRSGLFRPITSRNLLKWADRIATLLANQGEFSSKSVDWMFLDAVDCFAGSLPLSDVKDVIVSSIAEELHIDPQRREYLMTDRTIACETSKMKGSIRIGRSIILRASDNDSRLKRSHRNPFANSLHSMRILEEASVAVQCNEPLLLIGETGTGKTTVIQHLADQVGRKLVPFNLSQQSESGDLLGGFKPLNVRTVIMPLKEEFDDLFTRTFGQKKNQSFTESLGKAFAKAQWKRVCKLWKAALDMVAELRQHQSSPWLEDHPTKRRKTDTQATIRSEAFPEERWAKFANDVKDLEAQLASRSDSFAFAFVEGNIIKAIRNGDWVLLDEINLASPDTLEALADLFVGGNDSARSILLTEAGNVERVKAHPNFRIFAAMNPATDVGKKDLPMGIRSKFTELYVSSPDRDRKSLQTIVEAYIGNSIDRTVASDVTDLYIEIQRLADSNSLVDGASQKPHFSLRTLTRALMFAQDTAPLCSLRRALLEGFHMSFSTFLDRQSDSTITPVIWKYLFSKHPNASAELRRPLRNPDDGQQYVQFDQHWLRRGDLAIDEQPHYIITPFVQRNMGNLIRAASTRRFPVLIQGPTSSGKTSMIEYLAKMSGNRFVRINNHEHTDLQEYLGTYVSGSDGQLRFQEGVLVKALREGHWIALDELNLAPTDVLEALNRLLDDNRELLIPETQETVRPHHNFMLFATQNPAGLYGGRKTLSRAFRNRFLELHFDDIPVEELQEILQRRTLIPESWARRIVETYRELSALRQETRMFEQKSFATLRDLFRWSLRKAESAEELAANGFMLLADRVRKPDERLAVKNVIERVMSRRGPRVRIDEEKLYSTDNSPEMMAAETLHSSGMVWTRAMRRLFILVANALRNNEPVLLVGDTGCGKTSVCQVLSKALDRSLHIVNAHQNTETGDLIGSQRPIRNRGAIEQDLRDALTTSLATTLADADMAPNDISMLLKVYDGLNENELSKVLEDDQRKIRQLRVKHLALFEWSDGSLVEAMRNGQHFLLDEISLADDSVLERLNSVLESQRTLLLAEKGSIDSLVVARGGFQFLATMNPGGDFGKKELSPALRNRFTEIWVPALSDSEDVLQIVSAKLVPEAANYAPAIVAFAKWFNGRYNSTAASSISIRDALAWIEFINRRPPHDLVSALVHGAAMVFIDTLGANPAALLAISPAVVDVERRVCLEELSKILQVDAASVYFAEVSVSVSECHFNAGLFNIARGNSCAIGSSFSFTAPTTQQNTMRVVRALQLHKPILLEGNPGVGKTTLVTAVAKAIGRRLERINLSEQTDLMDLFGSDVPVEGMQVGAFTWKDAPFLTAMKRGDWVLLDEMNLASQSVLEGLNACLDHRGEVYVAELDQTFRRHPDFRLFAAQNPHHQGGGRKGLPASFVNRFTVVYADVFRPNDLQIICKQVFPNTQDAQIRNITSFVSKLDAEILHHRGFGAHGAPWEFNLRDTLRWLHLINVEHGLLRNGDAQDFIDILFSQRFRDLDDRVHVAGLFQECFETSIRPRNFYHNLSANSMQVGLGLLERNKLLSDSPLTKFLVPTQQLPTMEALMICVEQNWPVILVGASGAGKTSLIEKLANTVGARLTKFDVHSDLDATDLVGGYEQLDSPRAIQRFLNRYRKTLQRLAIQELQMSPNNLDIGAPSEVLAILNNHESAINRDTLIAIQQTLKHLSASNSELFEELLEECDEFISSPLLSDGPRFEWVDGILIEAIEQGDWLVLDNANLCSSSVLDRLNSLLEPDGHLTINEHANANGEARLLKPHPSFRVFLTMNPRYGELSRAMRNRAVELFLFPRSQKWDHDGVISASEAKISRFRLFMAADIDQSSLSQSALTDILADHLSLGDSLLVPSFLDQVPAGLLDAQDLASSTSVSFNHLFNLDSHIIQNINKNYESLLHSLNLQLSLQNAQSIHPLNNHALVLHTSPSLARAQWLASAFECMIRLSKMDHEMQAIHNRGSRVSQITLLERSLRSTERMDSANELTVNIGPFLSQVLKAIVQWLLAVANVPEADGSFRFIRDMETFWWYILHLVDRSTIDEDILETSLAVGQSMRFRLENGTTTAMSLAKCWHDSFALVRPSRKMETGRSMERMWLCLKPQVPPTFSGLEQLWRLERLSERFDSLIFQGFMPLTQLVELRKLFAASLQGFAKNNVSSDDLSLQLQQGLESLERSASKNSSELIPHFHSIYELLTQRVGIDGHHESPTLLPMLEMLATRPTRLSAPHADNSEQQYLQRIPIECERDSVCIIKDDVCERILGQLTRVSSVPLRRLTLLQEETGVLGRVISSSPGLLCDDVHACFDAVLEKLLSAIISVHHDSVTSDDAIGKVKEATRVSPAGLEANNDLDLASVLSDGLDPVATYLRSTFKTQEEKLQTASRAWIAYGVTCVMLYVPSRPFDPALRPQVLRELFQRRRADLQKNLNALQAFQTLFTAQQSNLRINLVEAEIADMGFEPEALAIARPPVSQMGSLVEDFRTVLRIIQPLNGSGKHMDRKDRSLLERNIYQLLHRLADQYRGYADITVPLIGFLKAIRIGLAFASQAEDLQRASQSQERRVFKAFANFTPFISDQTVAAVETTAARYQLLEHSYFSAQKQASLCILGLYQVALRRGLKYDHQFDKTIFEEASYSLRRVYDLWKARLEIEQKEHSAKTSLYTYRRGKTEEETKDESELEDLFPTYEDADQQTEHSNLTAPQELAISLCAAHRAVFLDRTNSVHMLPSIMQRAVKLLVYSGADVHSNATFAAVDAFPSVILELSQMKDSITATSNPKASPSFYKDPNIAEAQRLVALVNRVKRRFQEIHNRWPEHATPIEVLRISEEALSFSISEPVTKYLTKLEKLHEGVHEWQRIASREFTAQPLYEELTKLIVSWRQLELRTWARLFDIETESYRRGAQSWWFVAYENLVVAPMSILDSGTFVDQHTKSLLETLEDFFTNSTLGQFETRLQLLEQFEAHLAFEVAFDSSTSPVHAALRRFIRHFSTFLQPVQDALLQGRQRLEKDVNDVLRLASWKDTTIDALKQSAKTSHRKLFRLVRKFRDLLGQPVRPFLQQWPQEPENAKSNGSKSVRKIQSAELKPQALEFCDLNVQNWTARPARFQNVASTLKLMRELASSDESKIQTPSLINALLEDLTGSVGKLQKETPLILTEDNAEVVKHLKTRKRRLFADTLKNLRQMGFKSNLPEEALSAQDSCAAVLASLPLPPVGRAAVQMEEAERYFHRSLHLMDHVRGVAREHSADLTPAEVSRSIAYLESMVQHAIQQSRQISSAATHVEKLRVLTTAAASIWNPENYKTKPLSKSGSRNLDAIRDQLFALLPLIRFCAQLCTAQLNLAQMASQGHPVLQMLDKWAKKFERMQTNSEVLPKLPKGVSSTLHEQYLSEVRSLIDGFQSDIAIAEQQDSMFRPLFKHLSPWLDSAIAEEVNGVAETAAVKVDEFQETLFKVIDRILASCQDLRTATTSLPTSEKSWFLAEQTSLERSLNALNAEEICGHVETLLEHLHGTKKDTLQKFSAMTATVLPIFQQHLTMFDDLLSEYISLHTSTCHLSSRLTEIFILVGTKGFCTPPDKSRGKEDTTDQLEEGTGLGEGEGAEDISKDVNDDEDLSDLAQQPGSKQDREEIEDEKDAVDMADEGMEGEMGDVSDKGEDEGSTGSGEEDEKDIEEEVGEVDDLGASTVDEKMWDDGGKAEKEKEGKKGLGKKEEDQAAAQENGEERVEEDVEPATEEVEEVARDQMETADPKMKEEDTLDLPEDMDMDGKPEELSDVASSEELDFSDAEQDAEGTVDDDGGADTEEDAQDDGMGLGPDEPVTNEDEDDNSQIRDSSEGVEEQKDPEQRNQEDEQILTHQDTDTGAEDAAQSDEKGVGNDVQQDSGEDKSSTNAAQQAQGTMKEGENEEPTAAGENGTKETSQQDVTGRNEENDSAEQQAFRKLGDTLERWYNQQRQIREPAPEQNEREQAKDTEMADVDFEHLPHADATADTQALGSAAEDQAHALDESRAMEVTEYEEPDKMSEDDFEEQPSPQEKEPDQRHTPADTEAKDEDQLPTSRKSQAFVGDPKEHVDLDANHSDEAESESDVDNVDTQLSTIQLGSSNSLLRSAEEARSLWAQHEASTRTLALSLTEHLRLILAPTLATKMRGDFRTGKRLNIKRIIPYVASQYKRDKIWMRRSVPSKRSYQIMLALDDSKSMAESGTVTLAFETLALVARALTMLEAGEVSVVGFGEVVEVAHEFGKPLSSEAGAEVFRRFGFSQTKTDVRKLIAKSLELFREARMRASGSGAELWQLQLIISDGICEDHSTIQRLVRQAQEERIMVVFVIVDAAAKEAATGNGNQTPQSIMDLQTAEFGADENGEMKLIRRKYLDTFPFRWWIVVRDVNELPGVLATALRQWFAEVVDSAG